MELKSYQQKVIDDLETFLEYAAKSADLRQAFHKFWLEYKSVASPPAYQNNVPRVPHICLKVPTAGGKTFIAANALRPIFDELLKINPTRPQVVIWLVPSLTILDQTVKNLSNVSHPYRQKLNTHFNGRVNIYSKSDVLQGADFSPDAIKNQLSIIVMSFDSFRTQNKEGRKVYQENGYLAGFGAEVREQETALDETDETALINVLRSFAPVLIVDESHNAISDLSIEMLRNLNPSFILDLTATPRENSNIISYVDALELKKQQMVKLPVIVSNFKDKSDVIVNAIQFRKRLEEAAEAEQKLGGKFIRPIVLFQAQSNTDEDKTTFDKIKNQLIEIGIPESEIKIKTATINELKDVDLMAEDCPVRYIITINALKEGWDCPFAYILASLANKASTVDVEQILGRVLRQPYTRTHAMPLLNTSYVMTASTNFETSTLSQIVEGLNRAGFSRRDFRGKNFAEEEIVKPAQPTQPTFGEFDFMGVPTATETTTAENTDSDEIHISDIKTAVESSAGNDVIESIAKTAVEQNTIYQQQADAIDEAEIFPLEIQEKMNIQPMMGAFADEAKKIFIPQFFRQIEGGGGFFDENTTEVLFENNSLLEGFELSKKDIDIRFENLDSQVYVVDLQETANDDYKPVYKKLDAERRKRFNEFILSSPDERKVELTTNRLSEMIGKMSPIDDKEIRKYIKNVLGSLPIDQLRDCLENDYLYSQRIKQKINDLGTIEKERKFNEFLKTGKIIVKENFVFTPNIVITNYAPNIDKSLYVQEDSINNFESRVINNIANLDNIVFWHRNLERKGFRINGFLNHYPDFIVVTKKGKILIVETKGDDRDNSDSLQKLNLGNIWAAKAGDEFEYLMIFDNKQVDGAYRLNDAINLISQM